MKLRSRITLGYVLLVVSSFSLVIYLILRDVRPRYLEAVEESTVDTAELLAAVISQQAVNSEIRSENVNEVMKTISKRSFMAKIYGAEKQKVNLIVYITDKNGILLYDSTANVKPGSDFSKWNDIHPHLTGEIRCSVHKNDSRRSNNFNYVCCCTYRKKRRTHWSCLGRKAKK
ncbi:MAG: hypothetical protein IPK68_09700 [Bdellovibrionales bacterium]|nr:hypothetical protein [Bdellovibrionales bacterium]